MSRINVIVAGIGGVGGYFGGQMAKHFSDSDTAEIKFIARGSHLKAIRDNGLKIIKGNSELVARPALATDNAAEAGIADYIIVCTKSYDLEAVIHQLQPCINKDTIILPLLNGINNRERIQKLLPDNLVLDGCVYIVSRLKQAGIVENSGNVQLLYFGLDGCEDKRLAQLEELFKAAGIDAGYSKNIATVIWEKFIFLSPTATATSYFDKTIGALLADENCFDMVRTLIKEVHQVALARQVPVSNDIIEKTIARLQGMPYDATTSMHQDIRDKKPENEAASLTGYVLSEGARFNIALPAYEEAYRRLRP